MAYGTLFLFKNSQLSLQMMFVAAELPYTPPCLKLSYALDMSGGGQFPKGCWPPALTSLCLHLTALSGKMIFCRCS